MPQFDFSNMRPEPEPSHREHKRAAELTSWPWPTTDALQSVWLLGLPPMERFLDEMEDFACAEGNGKRVDWIAAWSRANDRYIELEKTEAGLANKGSHRALPAALVPLAEKVRQHRYFQKTFRHVETSFGMVELDRLVVYQMNVTRNFVEAGMRALGPAPTARAVFGRCLPIQQRNDARVKLQKLGPRRYAYSCPSTDLRFQGGVMLDPDLYEDVSSPGPIAAMLGLPVGYGCNFMNIIKVGSRHLLHNGYHRACALRSLGVTHAPCVIQTVTRADEIAAITSTRVADDPSFYFESARPPMLKDFFDPRLYAIFNMRPKTRWVEISYEVKETMIADD